MGSIQLPQGTYVGVAVNDVSQFHGIPYAQPFRRFQPPQAMEEAPKQENHNVASFGANAPQKPSRLGLVMGPLPPESGPQDEASCGVLSIYRSTSIPRESKAPVMVWIHGGAFISGGSQTTWYDGSRLSRDGHTVVVAVNYRLGLFGFLYDETRLQSPGTQDVIMSLEWVRSNIRYFGGDPENVTAFGQSAGGYLVQLLLDLRPDLFRRAIIQSSPADLAFSPDQARRVRQSVLDAIPGDKSLSEASVDELLNAQGKAIQANPDENVAFAPIITNGKPPGGRLNRTDPITAKDVLIGWTHDDGSCFASLGCEAFGMPKWMRESTAKFLGQAITELRFKIPSLKLRERLREEGHRVTTFELTWAPPGFPLGATHTTDLPLVFGNRDAWRYSPMVDDGKWEEWEKEGKLYRAALGRFANDGTPFGEMEGISAVVRWTQQSCKLDRTT